MKRLLTTEQRMMLAGAMEEAFVDLHQLDAFLRRRVGPGIHSYAKPGTLEETIVAIIARSEALTSARGAQSVPSLRELLQAFADFSESEHLRIVARSLLARLPTTKYEMFETTDPCQTLFPCDRPYFNRHKVRVGVAELVAPNLTRTLAINGPPGSGKTYSGQLVVHIEDRVNPPFEHAWVDLEDDPGWGLNPASLMRNIGLRMRLDTSAIAAGDSIGDLIGWFVGRVNERPELWWLVIDGISKVELSADVRALLRLMVKEVDRLTRLRLILLGCSDPAILGAGKHVRAEEIEPFDDEDIQDFLTSAFKHRRVAITPDAITALVELIVQMPLPDDLQGRMEVIEKRVEDAVFRRQV